ncbi:ABC transporter permease [Thermoleophilia bacterium SCSIO 60948]|nr:ABC transporter permease [Thermoleophilia bacterium SCSIO 60948]
MALRPTRRRARPGALATLSAFVLVAVIGLAIAAPLYSSAVADTDPFDNHLSDTTLVDGEPEYVVELGIPIGPTWSDHFLLGADGNGRDLAVRLLYGLRTSLAIALGAVVLALAIGLPLALLAAARGGRTDALIARGLDLIWSFPALMIGVLLGAALKLGGAQIGPLTIDAGSNALPLIVIGVAFIPYVARPMRARLAELSGEGFVEAAIVSGMSRGRMMRSELLPHLWPSLVVLTTLMFANAIVLEAALAFLGAALDPPEPSLGTLIADGIDNARASIHLLLVPSIALAAIVFALSGLAEALRARLDPHSKRPTELAP